MDGLDVRAFSLGPVQTNSYIVRADRQVPRALLIDPGEEPERLLEASRTLGLEIAAILITHCHFDHIGAVAPMAKATGAPVYCPDAERILLADIMSFVLPGFGPFEGYEADHTLSGGEVLELAGLHVEVLPTPGHSPGHLTYAVSAAGAADQGAPALDAEVALFSGDLLFQGSVGRVDLPGGDWAVLERSIRMLLEQFPPTTVVYPGHMGATTLGRERDTNPFLQELRAKTAPPEGERTSETAASAAPGTPGPASAAPGMGDAGAN
jgi:glyoxylase-like metal-dependent hydrolase (beta-lactamase superfamily II)